jgi:hypothetical protein
MVTDLMNRNMKNRLIKLLPVLALCAFTFVACEQEEDLGKPDRLFRPIFKDVTKGGTWIMLNWDKFEGAESFEIQLSTDSFATMAVDTSVTTTSLNITGLEYDTEYQCRIRSIGSELLADGTTIQSNWYVGDNVSTDDYPTLLITPESSDLLDNSVRMKWNASAVVYDHITFIKDSVLTTVPITEAENAACQKIVTGLDGKHSYVIKIYDAAGNYYGKKIYKTVAAQDFGENVVDVRGLNAATANSLITQSYIDSICTYYTGKKVTIVLDGGVSYKIPTILFSKNVEMFITTGLSFAGNAILYINSGFGVTAAETVNSLTFSNIIFTEGTDSGKKKTDSNYGGTYLFNFNQSGGNMNSLTLSGCDVRYKRGVVRLQTTATLGTVTINNCFMDSIGGYGIVNIDNAASTVNDILIKNSTISHADKVLVGSKPTISPNSVTLENVTTYYAPGSGIYICDYNGKAVPGGIVLKKCLLGPGKDAAGINGVRSSTTSLSVTDCYMASDLIWYTAAGATAPVSPLADVVDCGLASTALFADPVKLNFKITATALVNKIGDPRWW